MSDLAWYSSHEGSSHYKVPDTIHQICEFVRIAVECQWNRRTVRQDASLPIKKVFTGLKSRQKAAQYGLEPISLRSLATPSMGSHLFLHMRPDSGVRLIPLPFGLVNISSTRCMVLFSAQPYIYSLFISPFQDLLSTIIMLSPTFVALLTFELSAATRLRGGPRQMQRRGMVCVFLFSPR
jgi:hypothetical protein